METYTVQMGDTLFGVARKTGIPVAVLVQFNDLKDPGALQMGQKLKLPELTTDAPALAPVEEAPKNGTTATGLAINRKKFALPASQYFAQEMPKDLLVLHFTAGQTAASAYASWVNTPLQVATAYLLDTDGTVYECFPPRYWAYHLGVKGSDSNFNAHDKRSVGIEIANVGSLKKNGSQLNWWPPEDRYETKWCEVSEKKRYVKSAFRGFDYYAAFTAEQSKALPALVEHVCATCGIPKKLPPAAKRGVCDLKFFAGYQGIAAHQNFREDKSDVGPAFDWDRLR